MNLSTRKAARCVIGGLLLFGICSLAGNMGGTSAGSKTLVAAADQQSDSIKIGFLAPLSGVAAQGGPDLVNGIKLFLEQNHYRIAGKPVCYATN